MGIGWEEAPGGRTRMKYYLNLKCMYLMYPIRYADKVKSSSKYDGTGRAIYVVDGDRLCLQTDTELKIFDISDPTDLSLEGTVKIYNTMDSKLDDHYYTSPVSSSPYNNYYGSPYNYGYDYRQASYGGYNPYSNFNTFNNYSSYPSTALVGDGVICNDNLN